MGINYKRQYNGSGINTINRSSWRTKANSHFRRPIKRLTPQNVRFLRNLGLQVVAGLK